MGELSNILKEFDIKFSDRDDHEDMERSEFSFSQDAGEEDHDDDMDRGDMNDLGDDDRKIDFRDETDGSDNNMTDDTFAGERRVDITDKLRSMLGLDKETDDMNGEERYAPSMSELDLDSEDDGDDDQEFDFDVFNQRGTE